VDRSGGAVPAPTAKRPGTPGDRSRVSDTRVRSQTVVPHPDEQEAGTTVAGATRFDAAVARRWLALALAGIERDREAIDSLNVYPVPVSPSGTG